MKNILCVFAHPDDEAFGPGGTITKLAARGNVYLLCATDGNGPESKGRGRGKKGDLGLHRANELRRSAKILGAKKVFFLRFKDGTLNNNQYHRLARKIELYVKKLKPDTLLTFEQGGISGHLDHVAVSMITSFIFERAHSVKTLLQVCRLEEPGAKKGKYFVYVPPGYSKRNIDLVVDVKDVWQKKIKAMMQYESQIQDVQRMRALADRQPKKEYFLLRQKSGAAKRKIRI